MLQALLRRPHGLPAARALAADRDGTKDGYDLPLNAAVAAAVDVPVIASGGAGTLDHLVEALRGGADAALAASIFHYGEHTIAEAKARLADAGVAVRR